MSLSSVTQYLSFSNAGTRGEPQEDLHTLTHVLGENMTRDEEFNDDRQITTVQEVKDLSLFSATLLYQELEDRHFSELMSFLQKGYKFIGDNQAEKPIRGTRNATHVNKINDLREVLTGKHLISRAASNKSDAICRSEVLKKVKDIIIAADIDFRDTIRANSAIQKGYDIAPKKTHDSTLTEVEPEEAAKKSEPTTLPGDTMSSDMRTWFEQQFNRNHAGIDKINEKLVNMSAKTEVLEKALAEVEVKATINTQNITRIEKSIEKKENTVGKNELELQTRMQLKHYRERRYNDLRVGLLRITIKNTQAFAYKDDNLKHGRNIRPNTEAVLKKLNIDPRYALVISEKYGTPKTDDRVENLPTIIIQANTGCINETNTSRHVDHATYLINTRKDRDDDLLINRAVNNADLTATNFFGRWKAQNIITKYVVNKYGYFTIYPAETEGAFINVRNPLNIVTLENPTEERLRKANTAGWTVFRGEPTEAYEVRNSGAEKDAAVGESAIAK